MAKALFSHVAHWVFDLDNTLYPPESRLFAQIEPRMTAFVMEALGVTEAEANHLRVHYWKTYGTTLAGLMREHDVDPGPEEVLEARGLSGLFDAIYGVEHAGFLPKPERAAFEAIFARDGTDPARAAMFEDDPRNLAAPHAMGMRTVHVAPDRLDAAHIHHHTDDLSGFLGTLS